MIVNIDKNISYIPSTSNPLSSEVGIIKGASKTYLFDVGASEEALDLIKTIQGDKVVILSHFHPDHILNLNSINYSELYLGENTFRYLNKGTVVSSKIHIEDGEISMDIFPFKSGHAKGSLIVNVNNKYLFLGDSLYPGSKSNKACFNANILSWQIEELKSIDFEYGLISHRRPFDYKKDRIIEVFKSIYSKRNPKTAFIFINDDQMM